LGAIAALEPLPLIFREWLKLTNTLIVKKGLKKSRDIIGAIYRAFYENNIGIPVDVLAIDCLRRVHTPRLAAY
jgi:hypothetical protein